MTLPTNIDPATVDPATQVNDHATHHNSLHSVYNQGSSSTPDPVVSLPLTTLTGWTTHGGTWAASASGITQTGKTNTHFNLWLDASVDLPLSEIVMECEVMVPAFGIVNTRVGLIIGPRTNTTNGLCIYLEANNGTSGGLHRLYIENQAVTARGFAAITPIPFGTWATLKVVQRSGHFDTYLNGVFVFTHPWPWTSYDANITTRVGLANQGTDAAYRNFKLWTPDPLKVGPRGVVGPRGADGATLVGNTYIAIGPAQPTDPTNKPIWIKTS